MQTKNFYRQLIFWAFLWSFGISAVYAMPSASLGQVANNMLGPLGVITDVVYKICYILGGALIVTSIFQYKEHRNNPMQVPISRPLFLLLIGLILVALPFITRLSESAATITGR